MVSFNFSSKDLETDLGLEVDNIIIDRLRNSIEIDATSGCNDACSEESALAQFQMGATMNNFNVFIRAGFTEENQNNVPIITCNDSTNFIPVIYFKSSNVTKVSIDNNCIIAEASNQADVIRIKDRLLYGIFGIIK